METSLSKSLLEGSVKDENKASDQSNCDEESCGEEIVFQVGSAQRAQDDDGIKPGSPKYHKNLNGAMQLDDELESSKAEMEEVMEENQQLKMQLDRILKEYKTLQIQYRNVIQKEASKQTLQNHDDHSDEPEFFALSLGRTSSGTIKEETRKSPVIEKMDDEGLRLGLDCKFDKPKTLVIEPSPNLSSDNSVEELKDEAGETWPPKAMKNARDDEISQQNPAKRARVSVRVRCDTPTMNDGCQWRKYGQKIAKGNPCPRAYYRCTVAPSCPVRKQVQRCAEDMSILTTTYEGTHNHPLPVSATAIASTTSAAASMLLSSSSTSGTGPSPTGNLNGLNFYLSDNSRSKPFYLPNSSTPSFPTITLDLTSTSSSHLNRLPNFPPRYSTTNLNFTSLESNPPPISWSNGMLSYGTQPFNKNQTPSSLSFGGQSHETLYQSYLQKNIVNPNQQSDALAAATKAITSDPSFHSALAAALTSIIGSGEPSTSKLGNQNAGEKSSQNNKSSEPFPILSSFPSTSNPNKCVPNFLNTSSSSTSSQPSGLMFLSPQFGFSNSKSKSNSPGDSRDHVN